MPEETASHILQVHGLTKVYKQGRGNLHYALREVTFHLWEGEIYGLIGPNGAGKSTFISLLFGFTRPTAGRMTIMGDERMTPEARRRIGYMPEEFRCHRFWTVRGALSFFATLQGIPWRYREPLIESLLEEFQLKDASGTRISQCSKGMLQRVGLAQAVMGHPKLLVLDEPSAGLDPLGKAGMRQHILRLKQAGASILVTSHHMEEMEQICDRVGFLNEGRLVGEGTLDDVLLPRGSFRITWSLPNEKAWENFERRGFPYVQRKGLRGRLRTASEQERDAILLAIGALGGEIQTVKEEAETLEQALIRHVKESIDGSDLDSGDGFGL